ncbi:MAG: hypothetical protein BWY77_01054 [bacterium ADurb.Bin431]|nr:MAG: hypothetical protein BWY77_01054 [bacterium ADurb.Bin431]
MNEGELAPPPPTQPDPGAEEKQDGVVTEGEEELYQTSTLPFHPARCPLVNPEPEAEKFFNHEPRGRQRLLLDMFQRLSGQECVAVDLVEPGRHAVHHSHGLCIAVTAVMGPVIAGPEHIPRSHCDRHRGSEGLVVAQGPGQDRQRKKETINQGTTQRRPDSPAPQQHSEQQEQGQQHGHAPRQGGQPPGQAGRGQERPRGPLQGAHRQPDRQQKKKDEEALGVEIGIDDHQFRQKENQNKGDQSGHAAEEGAGDEPGQPGGGGTEKHLQQLDQQGMDTRQRISPRQQEGIERRHEQGRIDPVLAEAPAGEKIHRNAVIGAAVQRGRAADVLGQNDQDHPQQEPGGTDDPKQTPGHLRALHLFQPALQGSGFSFLTR